MKDVLSRFQILDENQLIAPGSCAVCGTHRGKFIDFGSSLEFYGAIYFCVTCLTDAASQLDFHSPQEWKKLTAQHDYAVAANKQLTEEIEAYKNVVDSLASIGGITGFAAPSFTVAPESSEVVPGADQEADGDESNSDEEQSGSPEQIDESGRSDVQRDDSLDTLLADLDI